MTIADVGEVGGAARPTAEDLPEGWEVVRLPDVCELNPPKPPRDALPPDASVTFVPMPAVDAELGEITTPKTRTFSEVRNGYTSFGEGDVIMAKITPCMENGKAAIARGLEHGLGFGSTEFHVLRPTEAVIADFVYHFIRQESLRRTAEAEMTGSVGQKRVPVRFLEAVEFSLPPLAEQRRIVATVEELLARVNAARDRLRRVPAILKRLRQAVFAAACSGRLTADWREEHPPHQSADEMLEDILAKRASKLAELGLDKRKQPVQPDEAQPTGFPEGWSMASMDQLTCLITSGSRGWAKYYSHLGPLFVRAQNINSDVLCLDDVAHVQPPDTAEGRRTRIRRGDLLVTITGANVTKSALVDRDVAEAYVSQHVALVRPADPFLSHFLFLWTVSPAHGRGKLTSDAYGAGKPGLSLDNIREMAIALPAVDEQHEIVRRVEALFRLADAIDRRVGAATARADRLTQSILAKAFGGELVPTEAELARREGRDYEPASVLLERVCRERARANIGPGRGGRRRVTQS